MTSGTISCGSAASGAPCRQVASGCPGIGASPQQGFQWTSGYWADAAASEIDYLPEPPATVEAGPNIAAPSADHIWLPGCWIWQQNRYAWRPGYWAQGNQDWDWVPDHYVWTPRGYVFVDGYYDYSVPRRGVVFAPVYFNGGLRTQRGFSYSPSTVINPAVFVSHLFLRPGYGHYYFGDYYGSNYANAGFSPWFSFQSSRRGYDPIYANQRWQHRHDRSWEQRAEANFQNLRDNENARPPRNWAAQAALAGARAGVQREGTSRWPRRSTSWPREKMVQLRFQPVDPAERQQFGQRGQEYRKYLQQRQQLEANAARTPAEILPPQPGRHAGTSRDLPSWHRRPISLAGTTHRHSDTKFSSRTFRFSPNREFVVNPSRRIGVRAKAVAKAPLEGKTQGGSRSQSRGDSKN